MPLDNSTVSCPLVFACDPDYAMPLATALLSVAEANRRAWPLQIYILSCGFPENMKAKVIDSMHMGSCLIHWVPVDLAAFVGFSTLRHISSTTYARLLITSTLPEGLSRILYLDADILVLDDLGPICEMDLDGAVLGAVVDERLSTYIKMGNTNFAGMPLPCVQDYFNAGVLLIDLIRWREERIAEKALEYLDLYPHSAYSDQDALNFACDRAWKKLDPRWNYYQIHLKGPVSDLNDQERPGIIHFQGCLKPWDPRSLNFNAGFYDSYRSRTLFARTLREKCGNVPIVVWSRLKSILRRSITARRVWNRFRSHNGSDNARRLSA